MNNLDIKIKEVSIKLSEKTILKNINMHMKNKEFISIIGPNGSGKTTLLKAIYRVLDIDKGEIYLNDKNLKDYSLKESAKNLGVVSQSNNEAFDFTVKDMVMIGRNPHKSLLESNNEEDYKIVEDALSKVGMGDFLNRSYKSLSGGEKQRIILARALAQKTRCLILDEPTNHLDIKNQFRFFNFIKKLDITVIAALHDLSLASLYSDKIYALKGGEIIAYGKPRDIISEELIYNLYEVRSKIKIDRQGFINITYKPY